MFLMALPLLALPLDSNRWVLNRRPHLVLGPDVDPLFVLLP